MVQTYTANPKFGDVGEFSRELDTATQRVEVLQSGVQLLGAELSGVSVRLAGQVLHSQQQKLVGERLSALVRV